MRSVRGIIALILSVALGLLAAKAVSWYLNRPAKAPQVQKAAPVQTEAPTPVSYADRIPLDMRLISVAVDEVSGVSRQLERGDRIDLIASTRIGNDGGAVSRTIAQDLEIYSISVPATDGKPVRRRGGWTVRLLVTPRQAALIAAAETSSELRMAVRKTGGEKMPPVRAEAGYGPRTGSLFPDERAAGVSSRIPPGMRAITLDIQNTDGICGRFRAGDRVDVLVTCPWGNISLQGQQEPGTTGVVKETHRNTRILLQDIEVMATEASLDWQTDTNARNERVTLLVSPADAEKLTVLADSKKGKSILRLVTRNSADSEKVTTPGVELLDLLTEQRPYLKVDMIRGPLRKEKTFYR